MITTIILTRIILTIIILAIIILAIIVLTIIISTIILTIKTIGKSSLVYHKIISVYETNYVNCLVDQLVNYYSTSKRMTIFVSFNPLYKSYIYPSSTFF